MSKSILDVLDTEAKVSVVIESLEALISKANRLAGAPSRGEKVDWKDKKGQWRHKADVATAVLNEILEELN